MKPDKWVFLLAISCLATFYANALLFADPNISSSSKSHLKRKDIEENTERSFRIDPSTRGFVKNGEPFRYISGTIHYFRVHPSDWRDRLEKLWHAGCNVVQTYVEWASHEPEPGVHDFEGGLNLFAFLNLAQEIGLLVILRPGPYIDAERDMGGLPYWLLRENPSMHLRSSDSSYLHYVDQWFSILFPLLKPYLYDQGGPIIMVQVENEYGSYEACDFYYTSHLRDLTRNILGPDIVLFSTDGGSTGYLKCGTIADVYATVDFGPSADVEKSFGAQRIFEPRGPLINSEFYSGWLDHWGAPHSASSIESVTNALDKILSMNASVNIYVFHGGTSFGMTAGSNLGSKFQACPTSYDFDAPLSEAGDPTEKYFAIRNVTQKYTNLPPGPAPGPSPKYAYGDVPVVLKVGVLELLGELESTSSKWPLTFEALSVFNGIVVYSTKIPYMLPDPARLSLFSIHDRGYVYVESNLMGVVSREQELYEIPIYGKPNQTISVVVESQGRICYGSQINDFKGITTNVSIGYEESLSNWKMTPLPLQNLTLLLNTIDRLYQKNLGQVQTAGGMAFYEGTFLVPVEPSHPKDTFLRLDGWTKGYVWINDFLLGRYWPAVGPQVTLYVPHGHLERGNNHLVLLELESSPCTDSAACKATLVTTPEIDGSTPQW